MKSKVTLIILLVVIVVLGGVSIFLGYKYSESQSEIETLSAKIDEVENETQSYNEEETTSSSQVTEIEKLAIAKFDSSKVDLSARADLDITEIQENATRINDVGFNVSVIIGPRISVNSSTTDALYYTYQVYFSEQEYILSDTANIVDVKTQSPGYSGAAYMFFLLDDGTLKYTFVADSSVAGYENQTLEFKNYDLTDVVALVNLGYTTSAGRSATCLGAITSDGVTHVISADL